MSTAPRSRRETSAGHIDRRPVLAQPGDTAAAVRLQVRWQGRRDWELVCVIGADGCVRGTLTAAELLVLREDAVLGTSAHLEPLRVSSDTDQEKMASSALHHNVAAMPVVDGLSLSHVGIGRLLGSELRTGLLIGAVLALLAFPMIWWVFGELRLAAAATLALPGASIVASVLGLVLPWLLARFGSDPACGSGPLATIVQDVLSLPIYFGRVTFIVL